jgi:truncated hemoglobin YjbI
MKKKKWNYVREYYEEEFLGEKISLWRYRFRLNEKKAEELIFTFTYGLDWIQLPEEKRQILLKKIEPDGEDYRLKKDGWE